MDKKSEVKQLFTAGFKESAKWTDWFFNNVYSDENALLAYDGNQPAACLLLAPYTLKLGNATVESGYISCCTTSPQHRRKGYMSRLLDDALREAANRGYAAVSLIPASERLYFFYDHFGFSTVFYSDEQRYTSLHSFQFSERYTETTPKFDHFSKLERMRHSSVLHSESDFKNILEDNAIDGGKVISVINKELGEPAAMLFATIGETAAVVRDILSTSEDATDSILSLLRDQIGERMIIIWAPPSDSPFSLKSRGMVRIVNVEKLLQAIAAEYPQTEQTIRIHD
ncbi:MAG: GNAT family N-acetyltransferase, partial [Muribaculaceae bacterium]|nr:GNAT family N-acetyltransferase [Muribaculaceae bacterium]